MRSAAKYARIRVLARSAKGYARWTRRAVESEYSLTPVTVAIPAADGQSGRESGIRVWRAGLRVTVSRSGRAVRRRQLSRINRHHRASAAVSRVRARGTNEESRSLQPLSSRLSAGRVIRSSRRPRCDSEADFERLLRRLRRLRRERRSRQHRSDRAEQTSKTNDRERRVENCNGDKEVNSEDLKVNHEFVACDCYYTGAHLLLLHACRLAQSLLRNLREHHNARMTRGVWRPSRVHCGI